MMYVDKNNSPCYKCPLHDRLLGSGCKQFCGCFQAWEPQHREEREKVYASRMVKQNADNVMFARIEEGRRVRWTCDKR